MPADTTTPVFKLVKQGVGNNNTTWGDILDANMVKVENAIAGLTSVDVTGQTSIALSVSQSSKPIIRFKGTFAGNTEVTIIAGGPRTWIMVNAVPFTHTLTIEVNSVEAVEIPSGYSYVYYDGNDIGGDSDEGNVFVSQN